MHLYFHVEQAQWQVLSPEEQLEAKTELTRLIQEIRSQPDTLLLTFSVVTPKADIGFLLLTPCLHDVNTFEKQIANSLGPEILVPTYSFLSTHQTGNGKPPEFPDWPILCFYAANMRRSDAHNWYELAPEKQQKLVMEELSLMKRWDGMVERFSTQGVGIDDAEHAVTLFAQSTVDIQDVMSQIRSGALGASFTEFGEFYIGLQLPLAELFRRLML